MGGRHRPSPRLAAELRHEIAEEAARLMVEHGIHDFSLAKRKAAERLGVHSGGGALPSNEQIHAQVLERQRLFAGEESDGRLTSLRRVAIKVMTILEPFRPRLVGAVLDGTAVASTAIELHTFSDAPEAIAMALQGCGLRLRNSQRRYRFSRETVEQIPGFSLFFEGEELEIMVFPERGSGHAPLSPVDGRPMRRASRSAVLTLIERAPH